MDEAGLEMVRMENPPVLLDAFFAETCSLGSPLACLEPGVALANDIKGALALDDLTVFMTPLHGHEG